MATDPNLPPPEPLPPITPDPGAPGEPKPTPPPVEEERGPVAPMKLPGDPSPPARV